MKLELLLGNLGVYNVYYYKTIHADDHSEIDLGTRQPEVESHEISAYHLLLWYINILYEKIKKNIISIREYDIKIITFNSQGYYKLAGS